MSERLRIAFLTGCAFVIGLHLKTAGQLIVDGWRGPYAAPTVAVDTPPSAEPEAAPREDDLALGGRAARSREADPGL